MLLLPFQQLTLYTQLHPDEVYRRLAAAVEPVRNFRDHCSRDHKPYQGKINPPRFKITRVIHDRNSAVPAITGRIRSEGAGSAIELVLRLKVAIALFLTIWLALAAYSAVDIASEAFSRGRSPALAFVWAGLFVFVSTVMQRGFVVESRKDQRFLEELIR